MNKRAQGIAEYALVIAVVSAALLAMQVYFKRGVQSVVKVSVDQLGGFSGSANRVISPDDIQHMADEQELNPKYGVLQDEKTRMTTDHSETVTTWATGEKQTEIHGWEDRSFDVSHGYPIVKGRVYYQELNN